MRFRFSALDGIAATRARCWDSRAASPLFRLWLECCLVGSTFRFGSGLRSVARDTADSTTGRAAALDREAVFRVLRARFLLRLAILDTPWIEIETRPIDRIEEAPPPLRERLPTIFVRFEQRSGERV